MKQQYESFPLFLKMEGKKILVVGGGRIALRRVKALARTGAEVTIVSEEFLPEFEKFLPEFADKDCEVNVESVKLIRRAFAEDDVKGCFLVLAATDDRELNHHIVMLGKAAGALVNNSSDMADCDFFFPALIEAGGLLCGVTSDGKDHKLVHDVCETIRHHMNTAAPEGESRTE